MAELARLWDKAQAAGGRVSQARLAEESGLKKSTVGDWATGHALPREASQVWEAGNVLAEWAGQTPPSIKDWEDLLAADQAVRGDREPGPGQPIGALDPFVLEVHRPVIVEEDRPGRGPLPPLPPYVHRPHDEQLGRVVERAVAGHSSIAVLTGGSSTGKTRACWEAIQQLPPGWRLWHPFDPIRPEAALADLNQVGPRTVIWLNDTQLYLNTPDDAGERVATALTILLTDPARAPVLVLGTLWRTHWDTLTRGGDGHRQARAVLEGTSIDVPDAFTGPALEDLRRAGTTDPRLAAAARTRDGRAAQFLAGVPTLMARYRHAEPSARALIEVAMDARRLGHGLALPRAFLEAAAPAYLTDTEWDAAGDDWLGQALAYTAAPCKGTAGPLTLLRPRPVGGIVKRAGEPVYRLADYLDEHARTSARSEIRPGPEFWAAAAAHAAAGDQISLGTAAQSRGLYQAAARLFMSAARQNSVSAALALVTLMHRVFPDDDRPLRWAATLDLQGRPADVLSLGILMEAAGLGDGSFKVAGRVFGTRWPSIPPPFVPLTLPSGSTNHSEPDIARASWESVLRAPLPDFHLYVQYRHRAPAVLAKLLDDLVRDDLAEKIAVIADRSFLSSVELALFPGAVVALCRRLRRAGLAGPAEFLLDRLAVTGYFEIIFNSWENQPDTNHPNYPHGPFHFGLDAIGKPATQWHWDNLLVPGAER